LRAISAEPRLGGHIHELSVTSAILEIALDYAGKIKDKKIKRIVAINIRVGELTGIIDVWMQQYFGYVSRGTLAEGARLEIQHVPITLECKECATEFAATTYEVANAKCPQCGKAQISIKTGREFLVEGIEVACDG
jgi:hydrogenase nickel incorporation protein HypA/HybF